MIIEKMLRFLIILSLTCVFHAKADPLDDLLSIVNKEVPRILENHDEFSNSIISAIYDLRDFSSDIIFSGPWNSTLYLSNVLSETARTIKGKECITRRQAEWKAKIPSINSELYKCVYDFIKMGDELRKKMQNEYERGLKIKAALLDLQRSCSGINSVPNTMCVNRAIVVLSDSFKTIIERMRFLVIDGKTLIAKVLGAAMNCNARLLDKVFIMTTDFQETLRKCLVLEN
ncbi:uncharacterized protein LOC122500923 [Leptopilina heterotoma]|uniref:uncharacterized protein LOC122500923 n=1 Tax=Leptopilina heterotoma TaxID=63436 RepID=UPI001CA84121|nr:uncharacterized protein LOC122500923 [Leptopilina heterotoma]